MLKSLKKQPNYRLIRFEPHPTHKIYVRGFGLYNQKTANNIAAWKALTRSKTLACQPIISIANIEILSRSFSYITLSYDIIVKC